MPSTSRICLLNKRLGLINSLPKSKKNLMLGSMKTLGRDTSVHQSLHRLLHSFMFPNPMALAYDRVKIIVTSIPIPLKIIIPFHSFLNSLTNSEVQNTSPKWIYGGGTIIFESRKETNGKPPSLPVEAALNQPLCFSASPI